jgi:hypothetical protein
LTIRSQIPSISLASDSLHAALIPIATKTLPAIPQSFFARRAEQVAPELIGCLLVKRQEGGELL